MTSVPPSKHRLFSFANFKKLGRRLWLQVALLVGFLATVRWASGAATILTWDASTANPSDGVQDGAGTWNSTNINWWNGATDQAWTDSTDAAPVIAQFGGGTNTASSRNVTLSGSFNVAGILFAPIAGAVTAANPGYLLSGGTITIADGGAITLADNISSSAALATINSNLAGNNITINRSTSATEQLLQLGGSNTWTGTLTLNGGTGGLFVRSTSAAVLNSLTTVIVPASVTLDLQGTGDPTYTSNFVVAGTGDSTAGRGAIRFDNDMTLTGTITMTGNTVLNFQSSTPTASDVIFTGGITESGGSFNFTKTGLGMLTLRGASSYSGSTIIAPAGSAADPGMLILDFANSTTTTANMLYSGVAPGALVLTGDTARDVGASTATLVVMGGIFQDNTQSFNGVTVTGPTAITAQSGAAGSVELTLGSITRSASGATLSITAPATGTITTTTNNGTLLGTWASYLDPNGNMSWAGSDNSGNIDAFTGDLKYTTGSNISALAGYSNTSNLIVSNTSSGAVAQSSGNTSINTITMSGTNADRVVTVGAGNTLDLGPVGGIQLLTGARSLTIGSTVNTGTLTAGTAANTELFLSNFDSLNILTINSVIANNVGGALNVVLNGVGTTIFAGTNTYTGSTIVNSGVLEILSNSALGATSGNTLVAFGASLQLAGGLIVSEPLFLGGTGVANNGALEAVSGNNTSNGLVTLNGDSRIAADAGSTLTFFLTSAGGTVIKGNNVNVTFGGAGTITVNSVINTGTGGLTKTDSGTLFLNAANTYSGSTSITGGIVEVSNAAGLGSTSAGTTVSAGAALQLTGGITAGAETLNLNGSGVNNGGALESVSGNNSYGGTITLQSAARIDSDSGTLTLAGSGANGAVTGAFPLTLGGAGDIIVTKPITIGTGTLTKDGAGTLTLDAADTYTGLTTISNGTLALGANDVFANTAPVTVDGGTFSLSTFSDTLGAVILKNGAITGSTGVLTATGYTVQNGSISAILAGSSATTGLTKNTSNTVTLTGANIYTGTTTISDGRLVLDYSGGATVLPATDAVAFSGGTLEVKDTGSPAALSLGAFTTGNSTGLSTLDVDAGVSLTAASLTRNSGTSLLIDLSAPGSSLAFTTAPATNNGQVTAGSGNAAIVMKDANGRYDFAALGAGNTIVRLNSTTALPASGASSTKGYVFTANNSTFSLTNSETVSSLRIDTTASGGSLDLNGQNLTLSLLGLLNDGSNDFTITDSGTTGGLNGSNAVFIYQFGTGTLTLDAPVTGPQTFFMGTGLVDWTGAAGNAGANYILGATVRLSGAGLTLNNSVPTGNGVGVLNIGNGGILELNSGDFTRSLGTGNNNINFYSGGAGFSAFGSDHAVNLGGAGATVTWGSGGFLATGSKLILGSPYANATVDFQNSLNLAGGYQTVEVQSPNISGVGGKISGNITSTGGGLTKTGQGILNLAGANTYTGYTAVSAGTLLVTGSVAGSSSVSVASGAELHLSGGGTVSAGTMSLADGSQLSLEIGTLTSAPISLTGNTTLSGDITLALTLTADPTDGTTYVLIDDGTALAGYSSGARFVADGETLAEGSTFNVTSNGFSQDFQISYAGGGDGNDVTIQSVPEPGALALMIPPALLLIGSTQLLRRRRRILRS